MRLSVKLCILIKCGFDNNLPSRQHLRRVKQNKVAPPRKGSKLYAATLWLRQEVTQSHAEDLWDLLHGMHAGVSYAI